MNYFEDYELDNSINELNDFYAKFFLIDAPFNEKESVEYEALFGGGIVQDPYSSDSSLEISSSSPDAFFSSSSEEESDLNMSPPTSEGEGHLASLILEIDPYSSMLWPTYIHPQADTLAAPASSTKRAWESKRMRSKVFFSFIKNLCFLGEQKSRLKQTFILMLFLKLIQFKESIKI